MKRRFIVIVLDGFGMGATKDAAIKRPGDEKACTIGSILKDHPEFIMNVNLSYTQLERPDFVEEEPLREGYVRCPVCGAKFPRTVGRFCPECGTRIEVEE